MAGFFDSLSTSVTSRWNSFTKTISDVFTTSTPKPTTIQQPTKQTVQPSQPRTVYVPPQAQAPTPTFWGGVSNFLDGLQNVAGKVVTAVSTARDLKTANELEKIRNNAIKDLARQAPTTVQSTLPTTGDFIVDPYGARQSVMPTLLSGGLVGSGGNILLIVGAAALLIFAVKK